MEYRNPAAHSKNFAINQADLVRKTVFELIRIFWSNE